MNVNLTTLIPNLGSVLVAHPGDIVILSVPGPLSDEERVRINDLLNRAFDDTGVSGLVISGKLDLVAAIHDNGEIKIEVFRE